MQNRNRIKEIIAEGKTAEDAIKKALKELKLHRDHCEVHIIDKGKSGFLGLGSAKAKVKVREKKWRHSKNVLYDKPKKFRRGENAKPSKFAHKTDVKISYERKLKSLPEDIKQNGELAKKILSEILSYFGEKNTAIDLGWDDVQQRIIANFKCTNPQIVIGKEGNTLQAIQYLITLIVSRKTGKETSFQADTENYWKNYESKVISSVEYALKKVEQTQKPFRLRPMPPSMRRFVHRYLVEKSSIETISEGEGKWRKVVLKPKK